MRRRIKAIGGEWECQVGIDYDISFWEFLLTNRTNHITSMPLSAFSEPSSVRVKQMQLLTTGRESENSSFYLDLTSLE